MAIATPVKLKTDTPVALVAPRMARIAEIQQVALPKIEEGPVRRVVEAELESLVLKSFDAFKERFPRATAEGWYRWCAPLLADNRFRFVRTDNAWGAASVVSTFFEPLAVHELWMCRLEKSSHDPILLYQDFEAWGKSLGAYELRIGSMQGDIAAFAQRIGADIKMTSYAKRLRDV